MATLGFSTGDFHLTGLSLGQILDYCVQAGATAAEVSMRPGHEEELLTDRTLRRTLASFQYLSLHAPAPVPGVGLEAWVDRLFRVLAKVPTVRAITTHPDRLQAADIDYLAQMPLPIAFENMDRDKTCFQTPEEFQALEDAGLQFPYVLDVQHLFELDPSMRQAERMYEVMGRDLRHMHVSGEGEGRNHVLVHEAANQGAIVRFVERHATHPIILEGEVPAAEGEILPALRREIAFWNARFV